MKLLFALVIAIAVCEAAVTLKMVREINTNPKSLWRASLTSPMARLTHDEIRSLLGVDVERARNHPENPPLKTFTDEEIANAPDEFDPR